MRRIGETGWLLCLAGLPFANFLVYGWLDRWQAHTTWVHLWVLLLVGWTLLVPLRPVRPNPFLAAWIVWNSLSFLWVWVQFVHKSQYPLMLLMPWMHLVVLFGFYHAATQCWNRAFLHRLLRWVARAGVGCLAYALLQFIGFDQFYRQVDAWMPGDSVIGTVGNGMHLSVYLALLLPIFLWLGRWQWHLVSLAALATILRSGSATGVVCAAVAIAWWAWFQWPRWTWGPLSVLALVGCGWVAANPEYLNPHGRLETWADLWRHYFVGDDKRQITGVGIGHIMVASVLQPVTGTSVWRHAHSEWLQALIEQGVYGVVCLAGIVGTTAWTVWRLRQDDLALCLGGIFLVFFLSSLLGFPAHLWVLGSLGLLAYCGLTVLATEAAA